MAGSPGSTQPEQRAQQAELRFLKTHSRAANLHSKLSPIEKLRDKSSPLPKALYFWRGNEVAFKDHDADMG
jgi:hypothetical protein